jgi:hypothetical protein
MQGIYTHIPETNHVPKEYNVAAILSLLFMAPISLFPMLAVMYFYISTFRSYGPVQACNGIALPLPLPLLSEVCCSDQYGCFL